MEKRFGLELRATGQRATPSTAQKWLLSEPPCRNPNVESQTDTFHIAIPRIEENILVEVEENNIILWSLTHPIAQSALMQRESACINESLKAREGELMLQSLGSKNPIRPGELDHKRRRGEEDVGLDQGPNSLPSENKGQSSCHAVKSLLPYAAFILGIRMSDSDSQNVSGRDYDEGDETVSESFSPSTGGSTFNQIDEVEHVSLIAEENEGPLRPSTSTEDVSSSGRGKSPRVVVSKMFPHLSPRTVEEVVVSIIRKGVPRKLQALGQTLGPEVSSRPRALPAPGEASSSAPNPRQSSASHAPAVASSSDPTIAEADQTADEPSATQKKMLFLNSEVVQQQKCLLTRAETDEIHALLRGRIPYKALTDAVAKISSEVYDYLIFLTPEGYKKANLEPPDYGRDEKYEPVPIAVPAVKGMSPDRTFIAPAAAPHPKTKVALGAKKAAADPPIISVPDPAPTDASSGGGAAPELPVTLGPSRRGKEKRQEAEIEEVLTLKRTKRPAGTRSSDLHEGLRERDALASTLVDQIRDNVPGMETIMGWSCNQLGEQIAEDILWVSATERRIQELEKELAAAEDRAEKAEKKLGIAEGRAERAEQAEKEAIDKMKDANSLARFICTDEAIAKEFLTAFINTEAGDKLTWVYGQWAFSSGCRAIQEQVHTALTEGLEETDLPVVMALLPDDVADPGPKPYPKPGPSE
nr:serine/arginine repetitive matrix protein 2-like [Ipomoea batatas]